MSTAPSRSSSSARTRCSSVIGRSDADKREREAARIAETIAAHHAEAEQHRAAAAAAAAEKREIAGDAEAFAKLAARIRGHELEAERLELLAERLAGELEQVRAEAAQARWREARDAEEAAGARAAYRTHVPRVDDDVVRRLIGGQNVPGLPRRVAQALAGGDAPERAVGETGPLVAAS